MLISQGVMKECYEKGDIKYLIDIRNYIYLCTN